MDTLTAIEWLDKNGRYLLSGREHRYYPKVKDLEDYAKYYHESEMARKSVQNKEDAIEKISDLALLYVSPYKFHPNEYRKALNELIEFVITK